MKQKLLAIWASIKASAQGFWTKVTSDVNDLWEKDKGFVIAFGLIILAVKFREILINLIVSSGKALFQSAEKQNTDLDNQENNDNTTADNLVKKANQLPNDEKPVDPNWNQK